MKQNVYLYAPNFVAGHGSVTTVWLPYTVGCIWSYAMTNTRLRDNFHLAGLGLLRDPIDQVVAGLDNPRVCGFSTYIWNEQYNLALSQAIKQRWPYCVIIFGGPNVPNSESVHREWRTQYPWIDVSIRYEGERAFETVLLDILDNKLKRDYVAHRVEDLDIPSPYLTGVFDNIIHDRSYNYAMTLETNRGCPFACTFCDWGSLTYSKIKKFPLQKVFDEIDWAGRNKIEFVALADANFGVFADRDREIVNYFIKTKQRYGFPQQINSSWYKNSNDIVLDIAHQLTAAGLNRGLTLSVQSMHDQTLTAIKRQNMKLNDLSELFHECNRRQIPFYTELILGLPQETLTSWRQGHLDLLEMGQHGCVYVFPVELLRNSALTDQHAEYQIRSTVISDYWTCERSGINEVQHIATETSTMTAQEFVDATLFSWMIVTFHHHGWTELYARYLRRKGWSYKDIYHDLEIWLNQHDFFSQQITKLKESVENFYQQGKSLEYYAAWETVKDMYRERGKFLGYLADWFRSVCLDDLTEQVITLQELYIVDPDHPKAVEKVLNSNLVSWILDLEPIITNSPLRYRFENSSPWKNREEFLSYVVLRRKEGFGKARIQSLPEQISQDFKLNMECPMTSSKLSVN